MSDRLKPSSIAELDQLRGKLREIGVSERTMGSLLGFSQSTISEILLGEFESNRFKWNEFYAVLDRFTAPDRDLMDSVRKGEYPALWLLDILKRRGFTTSVDPRVPLRTFYLPEETVMVNGRVVDPLYLNFKTRPYQLAAPILVTELPTAENYHVSYSDENFADLTGRFSTNGLPLDPGAQRILRALHL